MIESPSPLDLAALDIFRTVAAEGSVTRAAERLGRVQSNVTTRVQQLEADTLRRMFAVFLAAVAVKVWFS